MKILVTGAGGFIGGHLARHFTEQGHEVTGVDIKPFHKWYHPGSELYLPLVMDLKDLFSCLEACFEQDRVYNLAANMGGMGFIENNKAECMLSVLINTNMLLAARDMKVKRYFFSSSACAYPIHKQSAANAFRLAEHDAYPANPEDGYGWEKLFSERMCRHFTEDFGLETRVARFHNVYGPMGTWRGGREKAPAAICRKVGECILTGKNEIEIWGDGKQTRSFMYIDDCIEGIERIMNGPYSEPVNLGSSEDVSINELVTMAEDIAGIPPLRRVYNMRAPQGVRGRNSDNTLIKERYGWEPTYPLRYGMEKTFDWIYDQLQSGDTESGRD